MKKKETTLERIHKEGLENKLIIQIPRSSYMIMIENKENKYKMTMFHPIEKHETCLGEHTRKEIEIMLQYVMRPR